MPVPLSKIKRQVLRGFIVAENIRVQIREVEQGMQRKNYLSRPGYPFGNGSLKARECNRLLNKLKDDYLNLLELQSKLAACYRRQRKEERRSNRTTF